MIAEECTIDTIWFHRGIWGPQGIEGCALRHVTIRGNVTGALAIWPPAWWGNHREVVNDPIVLANQLYYQRVDWAAACADSGGWQIAIQDSIVSGLPDTVLVASKRGRYFKGEPAAIERLRDMGVALPD